MKINIILAVIFFTLYQPAWAKEDFILESVAEELEYPWSIEFLPGGEGMLVSGRAGTITFLSENERYQVSGIPEVADAGQGGLLDIALDPGFRENRRIFFSYSRSGREGYSTAVASAILDGRQLREMKTIFRGLPESRTTIHYGSRLAFDNNGYLYITTGDRGNMENAQNLMSHAGKVLRINSDGSIPEDNPYSGRTDALPEIYSYGHRNPQGLVFDEKSGILWLHEHGPRGGDEVNIIKKGANYGWPLATLGVNYSGTPVSENTSLPGMEDPVIHWTPSIAPSGLDVYNSGLFPEWQGSLFAGALAGRRLVRLSVSGSRVLSQEVMLKDRIGRIRDVRVSPDGMVYILTDGKRGTLYRLAKNPGRAGQ